MAAACSPRSSPPTSSSMRRRPRSSFLRGGAVLIVASWMIVVVHLVELLVWAAFFVWQDAMPSASTSYYFALMQYTTVGSSFNLPLRWRLLDGMLPIAGLMTFAWSTGVLFTPRAGISERAAVAHPQAARRATLCEGRPVVKGFERFLTDDMRGIHYAVSIFIATTVLWILVKEFGDANPIWAISSMVATSDPQVKQALRRSAAGSSTRCSAARSDCFSCGLDIRVATAVRHGGDRDPLVVFRSRPGDVAPSAHHRGDRHRGRIAASRETDGMEQGLHRVGEVLFGCIVGIAVAWLCRRCGRCARRRPAARAERQMMPLNAAVSLAFVLTVG